MDLLRLVLSRQPLEKLLQFPRLDDRFWRLRCQVLVKEDATREDYPKYFTWKGELSSYGPKVIDRLWLQSRALFLCDVAVYIYYVSLHPASGKLSEPGGPTPVNVEEALTTGILEVQAAALSVGWFRGGYNLGTPIPWTPQLRAATLHYGPKEIPWEGGTLMKLLPFDISILPVEKLLERGYLRPLLRKILQESDPENVTSEILRVLEQLKERRARKSEELVNEEDVSDFIEEGYLLPILSSTRLEDTSFNRRVITYASAYARLPILRYLQKIGLTITPDNLDIFTNEILTITISREFRGRVEEIWKDQEIFRRLDPIVQTSYFIILGYEVSITTMQDFYIELMAKIGYPLTKDLLQFQSIDISAINRYDICYDPRWWAEFISTLVDNVVEDNSHYIDIYNLKAYALGQSKDTDSSDWELEPMIPGELPNYEQILRELRTP